MFPIRDKRGRVIGFGGRVLGNDTPKYLNSPETDIFHKGRQLYGLYEAQQDNAEPIVCLWSKAIWTWWRWRNTALITPLRR